MSIDYELDLEVDLNAIDETGLPWTYVDDAAHPERVKLGAYIVVGAGVVRAVAQVIDVIDSPGDSSRHGLVHVRAVDGSVAANSHLLSARSAAA